MGTVTCSITRHLAMSPDLLTLSYRQHDQSKHRFHGHTSQQSNAHVEQGIALQSSSDYLEMALSVSFLTEESNTMMYLYEILSS